MSDVRPQKTEDLSGPETEQLSAYRARQRRRNLITALALGGLVALFFLASIVRLGENAGVDRFSGN